MAVPDEVLQDLLLKIFDEDAQLSANEIKVIFDNKSQFKGITEIDEDDSLFASVFGALSIVNFSSSGQLFCQRCCRKCL